MRIQIQINNNPIELGLSGVREFIIHLYPEDKDNEKLLEALEKFLDRVNFGLTAITTYEQGKHLKITATEIL